MSGEIAEDIEAEDGLDVAELDDELEAKDAEDEDENMFSIPDEDEPDEDEKKKASEKEVDFEDLKTKYSDQATQLKDLEEKLSERDKEINRIAYQLRTSKKEAKEEDTDEVFTDAQLIGLLEEHEDDKAAQLQIMKLVAQQSLKTNKKETLDAVEVSQTKKDLDQFLTTTYPALQEESSEMRAGVDKMKAKFGVEDHPYGDWFGTASLILSNIEQIEKGAFERGKKAALGIKADDNRKKDIKNKGLELPKKKAGESKVVSSRVMKVVKQMEMTPGQAKIYQKLLNKSGSKSVAMED